MAHKFLIALKIKINKKKIFATLKKIASWVYTNCMNMEDLKLYIREQKKLHIITDPKLLKIYYRENLNIIILGLFFWFLFLLNDFIFDPITYDVSPWGSMTIDDIIDNWPKDLIVYDFRFVKKYEIDLTLFEIRTAKELCPSFDFISLIAQR